MMIFKTGTKRTEKSVSEPRPGAGQSQLPKKNKKRIAVPNREISEHVGCSSEKARNAKIADIALVSLFCGAGGLDLGFHQAGFRTSIAFDFNADAVKSFNANFDGEIADVADVEKLGPEGILLKVRSRIPKGSKIGVIGGPPCQGFSQANANSSADDPRNKLPQTYLKIVEALAKEYQVQFLLIENVSGIKAAKHSDTFDGIISGIEKFDFVCKYSELNSVHYGVPQERKRMILIGLPTKFAVNFKFPKLGDKVKTVRDAIGHFPAPTFFHRSLSAKDIPFHPNHWTMNPRSKKFDGKYIPEKQSRSFKKISWDKPSKTIAFGNREILVHPSGVRRLSIYEAMLLQGFPKSFVLKGNLSAQVTQVSNAVPPPMAKAIANALKSAINRSLKHK